MSIREILAKHHREREASLIRSQNPNVADVIENNICTIVALRRAEDKRKTIQDRIADRITDFSGSMWFLYLHTIWFCLWILINMGWTPLAKFDPYPFGLLTMIVSLEAIFL